MTNGCAVVIEQMGKRQTKGVMTDQCHDSKTRPAFAGDDPPLLVHLNRARSFAALIALAIVAGLCRAMLCFAQTLQQACTLRIHVDRLRNHKGVVGAVVFASAAGWPEDVNKSIRNHAASIDAATRSATVVIKNRPPGDTASSCSTTKTKT
jgi:hypothetical protein